MQKDAREEHEILGIWVSPAGTNKDQKKKMKKNVGQWCTQMKEPTIPANLKIESYKRRLCPQINY